MYSYKYRKRLSENKIFLFLIQNYYLLALFGSFIYMMDSSFRPGVFSSLIMLIMSIFILKKMSISVKDPVSIIVVFYIVYSFVSLLNSLVNGYSYNIGFTVFANSVLTIVFYFYGKKLNRTVIIKFMNTLLIGTTFLIIIGVVLYIIYPTFYINYLSRSIFNYDTYYTYYFNNRRLESFTNSIVLGSLCAVSFTYILNSFINKGRGKTILYLALLSIFLLGSILSFQRSSWLFVILSTLVLITYNVAASKNIIQSSRVFFIIMFIGFFIYFAFNDLAVSIFTRFLSISSAISERNSSWGEIFNMDIFSFIIGNGLGTFSHQSIGLVDLTINDGYYIKQIFEMGILGSLTLYIIVLISMKNGFRNLKHKLPFVLIVLGFLVQAIGSNILDFQLLGPIFWFSIGVLNNSDFSYKNQLKCTEVAIYNEH